MTRLFAKQLLIAILPVVALAALSTIWTTSASEQQMLEQLKDGIAVESQLHAAGLRSFLDERITELR
ncbi:MAG TPA: hypothetical protein VL096_22375, partial [Pirellulaceae bacterium]|nr:hypothetical protein [Pirellulaceae bacterium]